MGAAERSRVGRHAANLGLKVHLETSSTRRDDLAEAVEIARQVDSETVRCYPRYAGHVSEVMRQVIADLRALPELDPDRRFRFLLEQHEDLKSTELVRIVETLHNPRLSLLFDFGNMVNAYERPEEALAVMAPHVTEVHIKDIKIVPDRGGWGHLACKSGTGS
jgi:sugar phosphate isomerase/epimerase